jgi:hypothetical protein
MPFIMRPDSKTDENQLTLPESNQGKLKRNIIFDMLGHLFNSVASNKPYTSKG